jgi:hypothetical protein
MSTSIQADLPRDCQQGFGGRSGLFSAKVTVTHVNRDVLSDNAESINRRSFARRLVATTAIVLTPTLPSHAEKVTTPSAANIGPKPEGLSQADWDEVQAKYTNLLRVYGARLSAEEKHSLVNIFTTNQHMLVSIRSFSVNNGDPSACTLRVKTA